MPPVYVTKQQARIRIENRRLRVMDEQVEPPVELLSVPIGHVDELALFGNVGLTTPAIGLLLDQGIDVIFLTADGDYRGRLAGPLTPHIPLRRAQYSRLDQPAFVLAMAKGFVRAKIENQRNLLQRHNREESDPVLAETIERLAEFARQVDAKTALSSLRGLEGAATAAYFGGLRRLFDPAWNFHDRSRRPPADPVNVLLSLGYTLLAQAASGAVQTAGLDPYAGFLHEVVYNRPAAALDLMEEFRPVIDGVVLWCCRGGQLTPSDFSPGPPERPVVLSENGKKRFLAAYAQRMELKITHPLRGMQFPLRQCLVEQARQVAQRVQSGEAGYTGMGFR